MPAVPSVWPRTVLIEPTNKGWSPASGFMPCCSPKNALLIASASMGSIKAKRMINVWIGKTGKLGYLPPAGVPVP